jgi:hypothetical protein
MDAFFATLALILGMAKPAPLPGEEAAPQPAPTAQQRLDEREAKRRSAVAEQDKLKRDFARNCKKQVLTDKELQACREAYRRMSVN